VVGPPLASAGSTPGKGGGFPPEGLASADGAGAAVEVDDLQTAAAEVIAPPAEDDRVKAVRQDARNQDLSLTAVKQPADEVLDHLDAGC
jgi:hypothetical protein